MGYFEDITKKKKKKKSLGWKAKKVMAGISVDMKYKQQQRAARTKELDEIRRKATRKEEGKQVAKRAREKARKKYQPPQFDMFGFEPTQPAPTRKKKKKQSKEVDYYKEFFG